MAVTTRNTILFNAAAAVITVAAVAGVIRSYVNTPGSTPCDQRYRPADMDRLADLVIPCL